MAKLKRNLRPMPGRCLVTPLAVEEAEVGESGIILPKSLMQIQREELDQDEVVVLRVGATEDGKPAPVAPGDHIIVSAGLALRGKRIVAPSGKSMEVWVVNFGHIIAIVDDERLPAIPGTALEAEVAH